MFYSVQLVTNITSKQFILHISLSRPFFLQSKASLFGLGGNISQDAIGVNGKERLQSSELVNPTTIERLQTVVSQAFALLAAMQLEVFTSLAEGPHSAAHLARALGVAEDRISRLLYALVVSGFPGSGPVNPHSLNEQ